MNKKGFTLIEMLGVFTILAAILLVSIPSLIGVYKKTKENTYQRFLNTLYLATEAYAQTNNRYDFSLPNQKVYVKLEEVVKANYLKSTLLNPDTNETVNLEHYIEIAVNEDYTLNYNYVEEAPEINLTEPIYQVNPKTYTNQTVNVGITYGVEGTKLFKTTVPVTSNINVVKCGRVYNGTCNQEITKTIEAGVWYQVDGNVILTFTENGTVTAESVEGLNYESSSSMTVNNIDKKPPTVSVTQSGKNLSMTFDDSNSGLAGYTITTTTVTPSSWTAISGASATATWSASSAGTYYVHAKDNAGNTNFAGPYTMTANYFCKYSIGEYWEYNYTGAVQTFSTPCTGLYTLDVYGAQGGSYEGAVGGRGGYSYGYIFLASGDQLYIQVGGAGGAASPSHATQTSGGYNGGGAGGTWSYLGRTWYGSGGGGASHIAMTNRGVLSNYNSYRGEVIIVAGGGGGSIYDTGDSGNHNGGSGGGQSGLAGTGTSGTGGTQSAGGTSGNPSSNPITEASFGQGAYVSTGGFAGGGGGWYGGGAGISYGGAGGGSGYLNESKLSIDKSHGSLSDAKKGNGYVTITLVSTDI